MRALDPFTRGLRTFATDIADGFLEITHNGFALIGLAVMCGALTLVTQPELRQAGESQLFGWLQTRQGTPGVDIDLGAIDGAAPTVSGRGMTGVGTGILGTMPGTKKPQAWYDSGFLRRADSIAELGRLLGMKEGMLEATVERFNGFVVKGKDEDFGRGANEYDAWLGDKDH